ncbi:myelin-oligodendrocyte glycoprotein-like isoform X2 [Micropterus salmoides]|uniref:myelin-oligodendrocyte glycoprotein-like isoform X2 n=1 Tax=Micropterus salmoides TaxID=27706 RepID=UPI0018ECD104|nr:myelin-oligodendrocyte glycoprotein-like isoform X2 [Micropterus salmoides]
MELMFIAVLSSLSVVISAGESNVIGSREPVKVVVGDDVILPCHLEPPFNVKNQTVEWTFNNSIVHVYRNRKDKLVDQDQKFKGRTSLFPDEMTRGNISLKLTNVTEQDAGNYTCYVPKLHSQISKGNVTLIVAVTNKSTFPVGGIITIVVAAIIVAAIIVAAIIVAVKMRPEQ